MIDRAIIQRFDPERFPFAMQFLHRDRALFAEDEWFWRDTRAGAYVFGSHAAAEIQAAKMPYRIKDLDGEHRPMAVVCGTPQLESERQRRQQTRLAEMEAGVRRHVTPEEAYAELERRHLD